MIREVVEETVNGEFLIAPYATKGTAAGGVVEVLNDTYRWRQAGLEITVHGPASLEISKQLAPDFALPGSGVDLVSKAAVQVDVDLDMVWNNQEQVDGGHSPWQLDPAMVAIQFVNIHDPGAEHGEAVVSENTGIQAVIEFRLGSIARVYLRKLVRQDESGIWSVVGYDPR